MNRIRNFLPLGALLVGVAILAAPTQARADFELRYSTDGGSTFSAPVTTTNNPGLLSVTVDGLTIQASASDFLSATLSSLDLTVSGTLTTSNLNLIVQASVNGVFTSPPPQILSWKMTSSSDLTGLIETQQGFVSQVNTPFATGSILADTGPLTAPASGSTAFTGAVPYSWTVVYRLTGTGSLGQLISADNGEHIAPVPAPSTAVLALTGLPLLGLGLWLRRRMTRKAPVAA